MEIKRVFTEEGKSPFDYFEWEYANFAIYSDFGANKIDLKGIEVPKHFSKSAQRILITKYTRLTEVPLKTERVEEESINGRPVPLWLQRRRPLHDAYLVIKKYKQLQYQISNAKSSGQENLLSKLYEDLANTKVKMSKHFTYENSAKQIFERIAGFYAYWGWIYEYFDDEYSARAFYDEILYALCSQLFAPNTPTWFNAGLYWAYGIKGNKRGFWRVDPVTGEAYETKNTYKYAGAFACFVFEIKDTLFSENGDGIYDVIAQMVKAYTYGGGAGINWSSIRSKYEKFSNGNNASGSHPFMLTADRSASNILSGASQRRAANIFIKDIDDPEIEEFVSWKSDEEKKIQALGNAGYSMSFGGEAYQTVSGQSVNTTVRVQKEFWDYLNKNKDWPLKARTTGEVVKEVKAKHLWNKIVECVHASGDPGLQFDDIIQDWNTLSSTGRNRASNPCIAGNSLLITKNGLTKIEDIKDKIVELINPNGQFKKYKIIETGNKPLYRLSLKSGHSVEITDDHPIYDRKSKTYFTIKDWLRLDDKSRNNIEPIILPIEAQWTPQNKLDLTAIECVILGFLFGDGGPATSKKYVCAHSREDRKDDEVIELMCEYLSRDPSKYKTQCTISAKKFTKLWEDFNAPPETIVNRNLPDNIYRLTKPQLCAFLKGLYSANGCVQFTKNTKGISLKSISHQAISTIQRLLSLLGIYSYITINKSHKTIFSNGEHKCRKSYDLNISSFNGQKRFYDKIGFVQSYKMKILEDLINKSNSNRTKIKSSKIDIVELVGHDTVYDFQLQEEGEPAAWVNGFQLHNCSEFLPNGNAACNLASLNINKFVDSTGNIKIDEYFHIIRLMTIALDIVNSAGQVPSKLVAEGVHNYRYVGLGITGIHKTMMNIGMIYGDRKSMDFVATIYSLMTAQAYTVSSEIARELGPFPKYKDNKTSIWSVIENHYKASVGNPENSAYFNWAGEPLSIKPYEIKVGINKKIKGILHKKWKEVLRCSKAKGFRNASTTLLQPSGTLTFVLDAGTSAAEPVFSLINTKTMVDGTSMRVIADYAIGALRNLKYSEVEINDILEYFIGKRTLEEAPYFNEALLREYSFTDIDIQLIEKNLESCDRLIDAIDIEKLSLETKAKLGIKDNVNIFKRLGLSKEQYIIADKWICGAATFEDAPHIKAEHLAIFDTAVMSGYGVTRFIEPKNHINISSAIQPFISHSISKTINLPNWATKEDIAKLYKMAYEKGCKSITIYRDGSKKAQPLMTGVNLEWWDEDEKIKIYKRGERRKPPTRRELICHNINIKTLTGDKEIIIKFGEYEDGTPAEVYIETPEENQELNSAMNWLGRAISKMIQFGASIDDVHDSFINKPAGADLKGRTDHPYIVSCTSVIDLVVRLMKLEYEGDMTYCRHKPPLSAIRIGKYATTKSIGLYHSESIQDNNGNNLTGLLKKDSMTKIDYNSSICYICGKKITPQPGCYSCPHCGTEYGSCSLG